MLQQRTVTSWGNVRKGRHLTAAPAFRDDVPAAVAALVGAGNGLLPYGLGRSYGDSCLNVGGGLIETTRLDRVLAFDTEAGILRAEAGLSLDALHRITVPRGWFVPVTPGTRFVTLGGAVANDVHGKNHHLAGSFGCHVRRLALRRSDGTLMECGPDCETGLFRATIGGLGLTGLIESVEITLVPLASAEVEVENIPFDRLEAFFDLSADSADWPYTVAWVDCLARPPHLGRGIFSRGRPAADGPLTATPPGRPLTMPLEAPSGLINGLTVRAFNALYYRRPGARYCGRSHFQPFFYPLDGILRWNRMYGAAGFYQYQCVVPPDTARTAVPRLLDAISRAGEASFLAVLKTFGDVPPPGLLSFPGPGTTLALDFPNRGRSTLRLMTALDDIVRKAGGRLYPAKDARMPADLFRSGYPQWRAFAEYRDPAFASDLWRRVGAV
ncbi:FAD/FMN-containing dehydrogenase [Caenispirillum bisanense]|uniref:FAD/FMN-containing dehydrogenase n=2 Tax=Caenispirillum bisanense TaxID=414052 RepID=A0A286GUE3_9PROT|nr:FAD/FMN-containing dehydrogenase [Caenispirillum bisanense]